MPSTLITRLEFWVIDVACRLGPVIAFFLPNVPEGLPAPFLHKLLKLVMQFYHEIVITTNF
jgi:hypothetical protein